MTTSNAGSWRLAFCDRQAPLQESRYIARPAVALLRLSLNQRGQVVYTLRKPYDDGTIHIVMTPLELMERLVLIGLERSKADKRFC